MLLIRHRFTLIVSILLLICIGSVFLFQVGVEASPEISNWEVPGVEEPSCTPQGQTIVDFRVLQDRGYLSPNALVSVGDTVRMEGQAENIIRDRNCEERVVPIRFTWSMTFTSREGVKSNRPLIGQDTLEPRFNANEEGKYTITLSTSPVRKTIDIYSENTVAGGKWMSIGPDNVAGRIKAIAIDPVTKFMYAGAETGGLWRSRDSGNSWHPLSDNGVHSWGMPNIMINSLALTRTDNFATIYSGLGEHGGVWVYSEQGKHWARAGGNPNFCDNALLHRSTVNKIALNPADSSVLYAATDKGVFRTAIPGCWERVLSSPNPYKPVQDLVITKTQNPMIYASIENSGIYRASDDSPRQWTLLNGLPSSGLPPSNPYEGGKGFISEGDKRLRVSQQDLSAGVPPAGTTVNAGDPDVNRPLAGFRGNELHGDPNSDGTYFNELVYRHDTGRSQTCPFFNLAVDTTDIRLTPGSLGPRVLPSHPDFNSCLFAFHEREKYAVNPSFVDAEGKYLYPVDGSIYREDGNYRRIVLAVSETNPLIVYAGFEPEPYQVFRSADGGLTWSQTRSAPHRCDGQCNHNDVILVHPQNPDVLLLGQVALFGSVDGGNTWKDISLPNEKTGPYFHHGIHSDVLSLTFDQSNPSKFYAGTDGGIYRYDLVNNTPRSYWTPLNNELATSQFYDGAVAPLTRFFAAGGLQDNSNLHRKVSKTWEGIGGGGDGFHNEFDFISVPNSEIIYRNGYWGNTGISQWKTSGEGSFISGGTTFFTNPYRSTMAIINGTGQLYQARNLLSTPFVNCIEPTPSNINDHVTSVLFLKHPSLSSQDKIVTGMDDGSIYIIRNADGAPNRVICKTTDLNLGSKIYSNAPVTNCPRVPGAITDIALKPKTDTTMLADKIYATYTTANQGPGRVLDITVIFDEPNTAFCGRDITGDLPQGLQAKNIVVDPINNDILHVGTSHGLFTGKFNSADGTWRWTPSNGFPSVDVRSLDKQEKVGGTQAAVIRASTYGRGVWELLRPRIEDWNLASFQSANSSVLISSSLNRSVLSSSNISDCTIRQFDDPVSKNRMVAVDVNYAFPLPQNESIGIRSVVMDNSSDSGLFLSEVKKLQNNEGNETMHIIYAGQDAPLTLDTDGIRIEIFDASKRVLFSKICKTDLSWNNLEGHTLNVDAIGVNLEGPTETIFAPFSISTSNLTSSEQAALNNSVTPIEFVGKNGSKIDLSIPPQAEIQNKSWKFSGWIINGSKFDPNSKISILLSNDTNVTAQFIPLAEKEPNTVTLQALCECPAANGDNNARVNSTLLLNIPIATVFDSKVDINYTPTELKLKTATLKLKAPEIVELGNVSLRFVDWTITGQENQNDPTLTLNVSGDVVATANYQLR